MGYCGFELRYAAFLKERHAPVDDSLVIVPQGRIILLIVYLLKSYFGKRRKLCTGVGMLHFNDGRTGVALILDNDIGSAASRG